MTPRVPAAEWHPTLEDENELLRQDLARAKDEIRRQEAAIEAALWSIERAIQSLERRRP